MVNGRGPAARLQSGTTIACVMVGVIATGLALYTFMNLAWTGFPDSHLTDYDKAVHTPLTVLAWVEVILGVVLLALAFSRFVSRTRIVALVFAVIVFVVVAVTAQAGVPWYFGTHLGLDNGAGG